MMSTFELALFVVLTIYIIQPAHLSDIDFITGNDQFSTGTKGDKALTLDPNYKFLAAWEAETDEPENQPRETWPDVLAELRHGRNLEEREQEAAMRKTVDSLPASFDARQKWKKCRNLIGAVYDQGPCISDYAIIAASVVADRLCIAKNGKFRTLLSAQKVLGCYGTCKSGFIFPAFQHINSTGVCTGSLHSPKRGCVPFEPKPCSHGMDNREFGELETSGGVSLPNCSSLHPEEYTCPDKCTNAKYKKSMDKDLHYTSQVAWTSTNATQIQEEIMKNGPVGAAITMYDDFYKYKSGVYVKSKEARYEYIHKVKLIGWGTENGTDYWLGVNTFNKNWGLKGLVKLVRGKNYLFIETLVVAPTAKN